MRDPTGCNKNSASISVYRRPRAAANLKYIALPTGATLMADGRGKLDSAIHACEAAAHYAHADLAEQAALLAVPIAQAHALIDNNKRLAYITSVVFLRENGHPLPAEHSMTLGRLIEDALEHTKTTTATDISVWLRTVLT